MDYGSNISQTATFTASVTLTIVSQFVDLSRGNGHRISDQSYNATLRQLLHQLHSGFFHLLQALRIQDQSDFAVVTQPVGVGPKSHPFAPAGLQFGQSGCDVCLICIHKHLTGQVWLPLFALVKHMKILE